VRQMPALRLVGATLGPLLDVPDTSVRAGSPVMLAGVYRQGAPHDEHGARVKERGAREHREGAPGEKPGVGEQKRDALNKNVGASTEIRIAPRKTFAALSKNNDASA
jgi:hypothetical protein